MSTRTADMSTRTAELYVRPATAAELAAVVAMELESRYQPGVGESHRRETMRDGAAVGYCLPRKVRKIRQFGGFRTPSLLQGCRDRRGEH